MIFDIVEYIILEWTMPNESRISPNLVCLPPHPLFPLLFPYHKCLLFFLASSGPLRRQEYGSSIITALSTKKWQELIIVLQK